MTTLIVRGVPRGFPCLAAAAHSLRVAKALRAERIRVEQGGSVYEFDLAALEAHIRERRPYGDSLVRAGTLRNHLGWGNTVEPRRPTWSLPLSLQAAGKGD